MTRYMSNIKDGEVYKKALDNYKTYLTTKTDTDRRLVGGTVTRTRKLRAVAVQPFGATDKRIVRTSTAGYTALKDTLTAARVSETLTGAKTDASFVPAVFSGMATDVRKENLVKSKRTGLYYVQYGGAGDNVRCAFGATSATEEFEEGKAAVIAAYRTANTAKSYVRASVSPERFKGS